MADKIDRGGEWDSTYVLLEPGYYKAVVKEAVAKKSQQGNMMIETVLAILDAGYEEATIYNHLVFKPDEPDNFNNKKRRWFQGSAGVKFALEQPPDAVAKALVGKRVTIKVKNRKDDKGRDSNEIVGVHHYNWQPEDGKVSDTELGETLDLDEDEGGW